MGDGVRETREVLLLIEDGESICLSYRKISFCISVRMLAQEELA